MSYTNSTSPATPNGLPASAESNFASVSAPTPQPIYVSDRNALPRNSMGRARLRMALGLKGLGIYLLVIEALAEAGGRLERDWQTLAYMLGVKEADLRRVVEDFGLFEVIAADGKEYIVAVENFGAELNTVPVRNTKPNTKPNVKPNTKPVGNTGFKGNSASGVYRLGEHREALLRDAEWIAAVAAETGFEASDAAVAFDAFSAYVSGRDDIAYRTEGDMKKHFVNWVRKGCAEKALAKAREAERLRQGRDQYEREQAEAHLERKRRAATAVSYDEYCRRKGIETTGSLVSDIHRANNDK